MTTGISGTLKKWLLYAVPITFLLLSVAVMTCGGYLKEPLGEDDRLIDALHRVEQDVNAKNWEQAEKHIDEAKKAWDKIANRIQFSVERDKMMEINGSLAKMKGSIKAQDDKTVLEQIYYTYDVWENLGK
jgi:hypothetical protein